ncbi:MAG TPA: GH25 family lysozyme [Labilithrix sp.]|nr:GH25 family lysozyme [Labilithrix sp.]
MMMRSTVALGVSGVLFVGCAVPTDSEDDSAEASQELVAAPPFLGDPANGAVFAVDVSMYQNPLAPAELDCFWDSGVRHVVVGTQVEETTREQLAMAVARGMTVDAYVYLNWHDDMRGQLSEAFRRVRGFPIGRMWLDVEDEHLYGLGYLTRVSMLQAGIAECRAHAGVDCGIYTGPGFWKTYMNNTPLLGDVPVWYAQYNGKRSLSSWPTERFGGWQKPVAKQWAEEPLCNVGVDKDTMQVLGKPAVTVDRALPPDTGRAPPPPTGLYPADKAVVGIDVVKLMVDRIPRATRYELALEKWSGKEFRPFFTWATPDGFRNTFPSTSSIYRFRARAQNAHGWSAWSPPVVFEYGKNAGPRPL